MSAGSRFGVYFAVGMLLAMLIGCQPNAGLADRRPSAESSRDNRDNRGSRGDAPAPAADAAAASPASGATVPVVMTVSGMSCPLCAHNIDQQLHKIPGVQKVTINLGTGDVTALVARGAPLDRERFIGAIRQSGFTLKSVRLPDESAIACAACECETACGCAPAGEKCGETCRCHT